MAVTRSGHTRIVLVWCDGCGDAQLLLFKPQPGEFRFAVDERAVDQERSIALSPEAREALRGMVDRFLADPNLPPGLGRARLN